MSSTGGTLCKILEFSSAEFMSFKLSTNSIKFKFLKKLFIPSKFKTAKNPQTQFDSKWNSFQNSSKFNKKVSLYKNRQNRTKSIL